MKRVLLFFIILPLFYITVLGITYRRAVDLVAAKEVLSVEVDQSTQKIAEVSAEPVRLVIPAIGVDAAVESVGLDEKGNMDVPGSTTEVGWYSLGYRPGQHGNTVIDGHLDTKTGNPAVFFHLAELQLDDVLQVYDRTGIQYIYRVTKVQDYPYTLFPLRDVFGDYGMSRLILITCQGEFDMVEKTYSDRTVVYSDLVSIQ